MDSEWTGAAQNSIWKGRKGALMALAERGARDGHATAPSGPRAMKKKRAFSRKMPADFADCFLQKAWQTAEEPSIGVCGHIPQPANGNIVRVQSSGVPHDAFRISERKTSEKGF